MPSNAYQLFTSSHLEDVRRMIDSYNRLKGQGKGRRALDHISRGALLLLSAAWEVYIEDVLVESVTHLTKKVAAPDRLPSKVKKSIVAHTESHKHELKSFELAGGGWKTVYIELADQMTKALNTPNKEKVNSLCEHLFGMQNLSSNWTDQTVINDFTKYRGHIAHKVRASGGYVYVEKVQEYMAKIQTVVRETDNAMIDYLIQLTPGTRPWNRVTIQP